MTWKITTLSACLGDQVVFRNLEPVDARLDGLSATWQRLGLDHFAVPRKGSPEHAAYLLHLLNQAGSLRGSLPRRLLVIGDTLSGDGAVAAQLGKYLPTRAFIGHEQPAQPAKIEHQETIALATRWAALAEYNNWLASQGFTWDDGAALLLDLDKSLIGARGRNDRVIDEARVAAVRLTMCNALGAAYDETAFRALYDALNQSAYHFITADNQDYLAYMCLMVISGIIPQQEFWQSLQTRALDSITAFAACCEARRGLMSRELLAAHDQVNLGLAREDPTPFKEFRRAEYLETTRRMNTLASDASQEQVLASEIVVTAEVLSLACHALARGALVVGISDKPDEASLPTAAQVSGGHRALHRTLMKVFGKDIAE